MRNPLWKGADIGRSWFGAVGARGAERPLVAFQFARESDGDVPVAVVDVDAAVAAQAVPGPFCGPLFVAFGH